MDELVRCPNCDASIAAGEAHCPHCGAKQLPRRVVFAARREEFALTPDEEPVELLEQWQAEERPAPPVERRAEPVQAAGAAPAVVRWGGFFRRAAAFLLDWVVIVSLWALLFVLCYIGYRVGLSAYGRAVTWQNSPPLFFFVSWGWALLASGYFVLFHGMEGKTVGKWLLGLRVVGDQRARVTYGQAFLRWVATTVLAPGFFWVLWSHEKRAWHDLVAGTWVVRE